MKSPRLRNTDGLRAAMCIGIMAFHFHFALKSFGFDMEWARAFTDAFFVVSGFFLAVSSKARFDSLAGYWRFIRSRIARLYPLFAATNLVFLAAGVGIALHLLPSPDHPEQYDLARAPGVFLLIDAWGPNNWLVFNYVSWSISALFVAYLSLPLMVWAVDALRRWSALFPLAVLLAAEGLALALTGHTSTALHTDYGFLRVLPSFAFGVWAARAGLPTIPRTLLVALLIGYAAVFGATIAFPTEGLARYLLVFAGFALIVAADRQGIETPLANPALVSLAPYSLGIFLIHPVVGLLMFYPGQDLRAGNMALDIATVLTACALTVWLSKLSLGLFEKPAERLLMGLPMATPVTRPSREKP